MKKFALIFLVALSANGVFAQKAPPHPPKEQGAPGKSGSNAAQAIVSLPLGSTVPNEGLMMIGVDGKPINLHDAMGENGLLVMFSCNTCPYVIKGQNRTSQAMTLSQKMKIGMVIINSNEAQRDGEDSYQAMKQYAQLHSYTVPYVKDDNSMMADAFGATRTPEVFLFDKSGKLVYKGAMEDNPSEPEKSKEFYLAKAMQTLGENRPYKPLSTKSIGCSIKRRSL